MTTEQQQSQDADQTGLGQMNAARSTPAEKSPAETAAMNEAAKEASMMLLDKLLGEENQAATEEAQQNTEETNTQEQPVKKPEEKKPAKKAEKKPEPKVEQKPVEKTPADTDDEEPEDPKPRRRISAEKITEMASKAAAEATAETLRQMEERRLESEYARKQEAARREEQIDIPEEFRDEVERLREVQKLHPNDYKGRDLAKEFLESSQKERDYEKKWRKANPGVDFDWDDEEHSDFVDQNAVEVDERHLKNAERSIIKEQAIQEAEERFAKKYGQDIEEVRRSRTEAQLAPLRQQVDQMASKSLLEALRPDLVETFATDKAKVVEEIKNDPIAMEAVAAVEQWSLPALDAAVRVINNPNSYNSKSPEVQRLVNTAMHVEKVLSSVPREERPVAEDGRKFSTMRDYANMPASQRAKYYTVRDEELVPQLIIKTAQYEAGRIKSDLENKAEAFAKRMGYTKTESKPSQKTEQKPAREASAPSVRAQVAQPDAGNDDNGNVNGLPKAFWQSIGL
jgi:translation initiation factor IF-2